MLYLTVGSNLWLESQREITHDVWARLEPKALQVIRFASQINPSMHTKIRSFLSTDHQNVSNIIWPSHSRSLPLLMNSSESVSSGVSMSSTLMSRSSGVSRKSSDSTEPSLWSRERFMSGATRVRRLRWAMDSPTFRVVGGSGQAGQQSLDTE